ncbi:hypothetical protein T12_16890 [Trichinella patagoniensis]|uniref:Uncharacterized protein n=1 Tax=Trichinella patagoniensis TaxID=990121 RepID=A0A0V0ZG28_9BILA|nr:hypothetical protein T12_16890 [Trichinella patagoniensis]
MEVSDFCMLNKQLLLLKIQSVIEKHIFIIRQHYCDAFFAESNLFLMLIYSGNNVNHSFASLIAIIGNTGQHDFRGLSNIG